jgi:type IV pilus assembly protein PilA
MGPGHGAREELKLPFGISVWLCGEHRSPEFLRSRAGRDFVASLSGVWSAAGCMTAARHRLLMGHQGRITPPGPAVRPGSYAWPDLRREAEARWARGEPAAPVIAELRRRHASDPARAPSVRTMQRWFAEGRWLTDGPAGPHTGPIRAGGDAPSEGPVAGEDGGPTVIPQDGNGDTDTEVRAMTRPMCRPAPSRAPQRGFTFVEVLVVTIIIGLLAAVLIPAVLGQQERAQGGTAQSLLRSGASAIESAAVDAGYAAITTAKLREVEPNVAWQTDSGATSSANAISVSGLSDAGYTLATTTPDGRTFTLVKDAGTVPTVTRTCGPDCSW